MLKDILKVFFLISVNFDHFEILRAIGKGSFGKVSTYLQTIPSELNYCFLVNCIYCELTDRRALCCSLKIPTLYDSKFVFNLSFNARLVTYKTSQGFTLS